MEIFELEGKRFEIALEMLNEGDYIIYDKIGFQINDNKVKIYVWSDYINLENITKDIAMRDLNNAKTRLADILDKSKGLSDILKDKEFIYSVNLDEGKSGINICEEEKGSIKWFI